MGSVGGQTHHRGGGGADPSETGWVGCVGGQTHHSGVCETYERGGVCVSCVCVSVCECVCVLKCVCVHVCL